MISILIVDAVHRALALRPDVVLMDLRMPGGDGVTAIRALAERGSTARVLVMTTYGDDADVLAAVAGRLVGNLRAPRTPPGQALSDREVEVLALVSRGHNNREVARQLFISEATVKTHLLHV